MSTHNHHDSHEHEHGHNHHHHVSSMNKGRLFAVIIFNLIISFAEVVGGVISGSLSLISDAIHNLSDTASLILSYISIKISEKPKSKTKTYGYKRANILSAFINSASLIGISIFLVVEAIRKFITPQHINGNTVIIVAIVGLLGNSFSALFLKQGSKNSINIKSSYLHMLSDALSSVAVIIAGIVIKYFTIYWIDPVLTIFINVVILKSSYGVLKESIDILMQGTPIDTNMEAMEKDLLNIEGIKGVHHIHVWRLDENNNVFEGHIQVQDMLISESKTISDRVQHILMEHFNITHIVIQFESINCNEDNCRI
ncbi:cation diffusion facilitator family transporter [Clostridium manihotivorum]|uniref:Cation transporter n=1 Tax=Clostridium manihotivorum TaxID=2320868 RepID=A0A410DUJ6_9CLOT|nr:cation diffusion facilitator family transporter [Clostridium manihotivorum]QAA32731.1 cation transporter [Clostridium manihotivorum]